MKRLVPLLLLLSLSAVPGARAEIVERIIAKVNGQIITQTDFQARQVAALQAAGIDPSRAGAFLRENNARILQEAIDDVLLVQKAEAAGFSMRPEYLDSVIDNIKKENNITSEQQFAAELAREGMTLDELKRNITESIMRRQIVSRDLEPQILVSESEARADYEANKDSWSKPATVKIHEIVLDAADPGAEVLAGELAQRLRGGADFAELARQYSTAASKDTGVLGVFAKGELQPDIEAKVFSLTEGEISDPIRVGDTYRIAMITDKTEPRVVPFEEALPQIRRRLEAGRMEKAYEDYMTELRKEAITEVLVREVPLDVTGLPAAAPTQRFDALVPDEAAQGAPPPPPSRPGPSLPGVQDDEIVSVPRPSPSPQSQPQP